MRVSEILTKVGNFIKREDVINYIVTSVLAFVITIDLVVLFPTRLSYEAPIEIPTCTTVVNQIVIPPVTITPTPTVESTDRVQSYYNSDMNIWVNYPTGWEVVKYGQTNFDVEQTSGDGWLEIYNLLDNNQFMIHTPQQISSEIALDELLVFFDRDTRFSLIENSINSTDNGNIMDAYLSDSVSNDLLHIFTIKTGDQLLIGLGWSASNTTYDNVYQSIISSVAN